MGSPPNRHLRSFPRLVTNEPCVHGGDVADMPRGERRLVFIRFDNDSAARRNIAELVLVFRQKLDPSTFCVAHLSVHTASFFQIQER